MNAVKKYLKKQSFHPTLVSLVLNDFFLTRTALKSFVKRNAPSLQGKILDIGCGSKPYKGLFQFTEYIGIDIENEGHSHEEEDVDVYYDGTRFPFEDNTFDNIVCFEVLEHVFDQESFLNEIDRVLKPGGTVMLTTPFIWNEHEVPNDYGRLSSYGMKYVLEKRGFAVDRIEKMLNGPELLVVLFIAYLKDLQLKIIEAVDTKLTFPVLYVLFRPIILTCNLAGVILKIFPRDGRLYFNNGVLFSKKS